MNNDKLYGIVNGVYYCNMDKQNEINEKIYERNIPSLPLQPQYGIRPIGTKFNTLPIISSHKKTNISCNNYSEFNINNTFNPGNSTAPWSGFSSNINVESTLRNQFFGIQKCLQKEYIPSSQSELYHSKIPLNQRYIGPNNLLFEELEFNGFDPEPSNMEKQFYHNHTRQQVKNL